MSIVSSLLACTPSGHQTAENADDSNINKMWRLLRRVLSLLRRHNKRESAMHDEMAMPPTYDRHRNGLTFQVGGEKWLSRLLSRCSRLRCAALEIILRHGMITRQSYFDMAAKRPQPALCR